MVSVAEVEVSALSQYDQSIITSLMSLRALNNTLAYMPAWI